MEVSRQRQKCDINFSQFVLINEGPCSHGSVKMSEHTINVLLKELWKIVCFTDKSHMKGYKAHRMVNFFIYVTIFCIDG